MSGQHEWVSVAERGMPSEPGLYWVSADGLHWAEFNESHCLFTSSDLRVKEITHYQRIEKPEPPK